MKKTKILLLLFTATFSFLSGADQINESDAAGAANFHENITAKAFDRYTGDFYVGTAIAAPPIVGSDVNRRVARAGRNDTYFTGLSTVAATQGQVDYMALVNTARLNPATHVALQLNDIATLDIIDLAALGVPLQVAAALILDAAGNPAGDPAVGPPIIPPFTNLAGGYFRDTAGAGVNAGGYVFLRVHRGGAAGGGLPGPTVNARDSGILAFNVPGLVLVGTVGGNAVRLDDRRGAAPGDGNFLRAGSGVANLPAAALPRVTDMYWDEELETLFIAGSVSAENAPAAGPNYHLGLTKVQIVAGNLVISDIIPNGVNPRPSNFTIFTSRVNGGQPAGNVRMHKVNTMKTSTDRNYIIVNGSIQPHATPHEFGNEFYALQYDKNTGFIVRNDNNKTALTDGFGRANGAPIAANRLDGSHVDSLVIGGEGAPWNPAQGTASDMEVVGDTVYVSFYERRREAANDPGVWSSTAMFDNDGVIIGWTKWERVFPSVRVGATPHTDKTRFFAVDAQTGQLWSVKRPDAAATPIIVERTKIQTDFTAAAYNNSLQKRLNTELPNSCTCALDLPNETPGIAGFNNPDNSFALFGGIGKVVFAQTKSGNANVVTTAFDNFYHTTTLPSEAGVVRCLGASRNIDNNTRGYFFAGTDGGLYVYSAEAGNHAGFNGQPNNAAGLTTIKNGAGVLQAPFNAASDFRWRRMAADTITGPVTAIESNGTHLFVVEQDVTTVGRIVSRLHRFRIRSDVNRMELAANYLLIAESGTAPFAANTIFTGFRIVTQTDGTRANHYGVISTNAGIFVSTANLPVMVAANWTNVAVDPNRAYHSIYTPKRTPTGAMIGANEDGACHRVWGLVADDGDSGKNYYQNSRLQQFGFQNGRTNATLQPANYSCGDLAAGTAALTFLDRSLYFWTDGGRRFYTRFNANESVYNSLHSLPYYGAEWAMTEPESFSQLSSIPRIHWIENISGLGIVLAGTDTGVISLVE